MDEPPFALVCGWRYPLLIIAKGGSFSTVSTLRLYSSTSIACGFLYEEKQSVPDGERPVVHIAIICGFNRKFYKQRNSQQPVCDMQFTVVANESNRELRWQGVSYSGAHPVFILYKAVRSHLIIQRSLQNASTAPQPAPHSCCVQRISQMLPQYPIGFLRHRLAPFVRGILAGHFHGQMREPAIGCSTVPVLDLRGNVHHIARMQL